ncbi:hypothetical protein RCL1_007606 [Eukaryota sp. TZLM3-RCL]
MHNFTTVIGSEHALRNDFDELSSLFAAFQSFAKSNGFAIRQEGGSESRNRLYFNCFASGKFTSTPVPGTNGRDRVSLKTACPFRVYVFRNKNTSFKWRWSSETSNCSLQHNHCEVEDPTALPHHRFIPQVVQETILTANPSDTPKKILHQIPVINKGVDFSATAKDISNLRTKFLKNFKGDSSLVDTLMRQYGENFVFCVKYDEELKLSALFLYHKDALPLIAQFKNVLFLDCTYRTNVNNMPLLHGVGMTCLNTTFSAFFCLLRDETQSSYMWALKQLQNILISPPAVVVTDRELALMNALQDVFPYTNRILCWFHIRQNINSKHSAANSVFWEEMMSDIIDSVRSLTKDDFDSKLLSLINKWSDNEPIKPETDYYIKRWVPFQQFFAFYCINNYTHFGQITTCTSRKRVCPSCS